jgi:hypothetical protein
MINNRFFADWFVNKANQTLNPINNGTQFDGGAQRAQNRSTFSVAERNRRLRGTPPFDGGAQRAENRSSFTVEERNQRLSERKPTTPTTTTGTTSTPTTTTGTTPTPTTTFGINSTEEKKVLTEEEKEIQDNIARAERDSVVFEKLMAQYGFDARTSKQLADRMFKHLLDYDRATVTEVFLPEEQIFKERFIGNEMRKKQGLTPLSPESYLTLERQYKSVLKAYGLPAGFYDDPRTDFAGWIAGDVSPEEIGERARIASDWTKNLDPQSREALKKFYGIGDEALVAYALDAKRALPIIQRQAEAAKIGAEALRQNLAVGRSMAEQLTDIGVTDAQARQAFSSAAQITAPLQKLAAIEGKTLTQEDIIEQTLGIDPESERKVRGLASRERARFGGESGTARQILGGGMSGSY